MISEILILIKPHLQNAEKINLFDVDSKKYSASESVKKQSKKADIRMI